MLILFENGSQMDDYTHGRRGPPVVTFCEWECLDTGGAIMRPGGVVLLWGAFCEWEDWDTACAITRPGCVVLLKKPCIIARN